MAPRRRCPTCGSRQWHKEPLGGLIACSEGHVLQVQRTVSFIYEIPFHIIFQNYRSETNEADDYAGPHMTNKRKLKNTKEKKERGSKADPQCMFPCNKFHFVEMIHFACSIPWG